MIVVADTSPLHYLILIGQTELLRQLYGAVVIPDIVAAELRAGKAPREVIDWLSSPPMWLSVVVVTGVGIASTPEGSLRSVAGR